jgi:hypothetical protein
MRIKILIYFFAYLFLFSCEKQEITQLPVNYDYGYFPLDSGMWKEYDVTQIVIDKQSGVYDTVKYKLREVFAGWYLNAAGDSTMRIERFVRDSVNHPWRETTVWYAFINSRDAIQSENNIKYLKIKFPAILNSEWNGNVYNRLDTINTYNYKIISVDIAEQINNITFDSVLTVRQKFKESIIDKVDFFEKYAYKTGLIEKQQTDIYSSDVDPSIPIEERVTKGVMYYQKITRYGKN